jgi:hypothetical protein
VRFIAHFVGVYKRTAPLFARNSLRWSANPKNIQTYLESGHMMTDVLGLMLEEAAEQISKTEFHDIEWPYNQTLGVNSQ